VSEDPKKRLLDIEMEFQMAALTLTGQKTTAGTITWLLQELAKRPEYQDKLRLEIVEKRSEVNARGDEDFSMNDPESMEYLQAAIVVCRSCFTELIARLTPVIHRRRCIITVPYTIYFAL
jgi:cytochrome P450